MATFVTTIDLSLAPTLQKDLPSQGFTLTCPPHTVFSATRAGISCTLYLSGKLVVQGKDKDSFIRYYLEPQILKSLPYTHPELCIDTTPHIGVDEAGKGDFFGPLCVGAVHGDGETIQALLKLGVRDSKQLSDTTLIRIAPQIHATVPTAIVTLSPERYNTLYQNFPNLNYMLAWAHATAIAEVAAKTGCHHALVDQFTTAPLVEQALRKKGVQVHVTQRTKAEADVVVAAASIIARVAFVNSLTQLGHEIGMPLPKGASNLVIRAGHQLVHRFGSNLLPRVAKMHFKTAQQILSNCL